MSKLPRAKIIAQGFSLIECSTDAVVQVLAFCTPEELVEVGMCSELFASLAHTPRLWEAHGARLCSWLCDRNLLPPVFCEQVLKLDDEDSSISRPIAFLRSWGPKRFFTLRLGWRELVVRCALHSSNPSLMVLVHGRVYDLTDFGFAHPGSPEILRSVAGCDASLRFDAARHSAFAETMMGQFELRETKLAVTKTNYLGWLLLQKGSQSASKAMNFHGPVPQSVRNAWVTDASCVERRQRHRGSRGQVAEEKCVNTTATVGISSVGDAFVCPHCHGLCREAKIFAEWMSAPNHEGTAAKETASHAGTIQFEHRSIVKDLSEVPRWAGPSISVEFNNSRRLMRQQMRRHRAEQQQQAGGAGMVVFPSTQSAPPGTLTAM